MSKYRMYMKYSGEISFDLDLMINHKLFLVNIGPNCKNTKDNLIFD